MMVEIAIGNMDWDMNVLDLLVDFHRMALKENYVGFHKLEIHVGFHLWEIYVGFHTQEIHAGFHTLETLVGFHTLKIQDTGMAKTQIAGFHKKEIEEDQTCLFS